MAAVLLRLAALMLSRVALTSALSQGCAPELLLLPLLLPASPPSLAALAEEAASAGRMSRLLRLAPTPAILASTSA